MIDETFVTAIAELAREGSEATRRLVVVGGRTYALVGGSVALVEPPADKWTGALVFSTLASVAAYLNDNPDALDLDETAVLVKGPAEVEVFSRPIGEGHRRVRYYYAIAKPALPAYRFGEYLESEAFVIALQSMFEATDASRELLRVVGTISDENVKTWGDDGTTQSVTARAGVAFVAGVALPNPVELVPFRTFPEVEQPASKFILRAKSEGGKVKIALFEADGGAWRLPAIESVAEYLRDAIESHGSKKGEDETEEDKYVPVLA